MPETKSNRPTKLKVGDRVWVYNANRRRYQQDERGHSTGAPIWREHWVEHQVVGENLATYFLWSGSDTTFRVENLRLYHRIVKRDLKNGIKSGDMRLLIFSEQELNRRAWVQENGYELGEAVRRSNNYEILAQIARLVAPDLAPPEEL